MLAFSQKAGAQDVVVPEGYELVDSLIYIYAATVDSTLVGRNIFGELPSRSRGDAADVNVYQSAQIQAAMDTNFVHNSAKAISGYRVRIFFDNKQTARTNSEATLDKFNKMYPEVAAYRSYVNPYFKVTVGDFRTKSEAMRLLQEIKVTFPSAFVVKENINYPVVDSENPVWVDTVQVVRPIAKTRNDL